MKHLSTIFYSATLFLSFLNNGFSQSQSLFKFTDRGFYYGFAGWDPLDVIQTKNPTFLKLSGTSAGGAGILLDKLADISEDKCLLITLRKGSDTADKLSLKLIDSEGHWSRWDIPMDGVSEKEITVLRLPITTPNEKGDKGVDLEEIKQIQMQGTFNPSTTVSVELYEIAAGGDAAMATPNKTVVTP